MKVIAALGVVLLTVGAVLPPLNVCPVLQLPKVLVAALFQVKSS